MLGIKLTLSLILSLLLYACNTIRVKDIYTPLHENNPPNLIVTETIYNASMNQFDTFSNLYQIERVNFNNSKALISDFSFKVFSPTSLIFKKIFQDSSNTIYSSYYVDSFGQLSSQSVESNKRELNGYYSLLLYGPMSYELSGNKFLNSKVKLKEGFYVARTSLYHRKCDVFFDTSQQNIKRIKFFNNQHELEIKYCYIENKTINKSEYCNLFPLNNENKKLIHFLKEKKQEEIAKEAYIDSLVSTIKINEIFGTLTLIDFWNVGCRPVHNAFTELMKLRDTFSTEKLEIIAYSFDKQKRINHFKAQMNINLNMQEDTLFLRRYFNINSFPTTILLDENGQVIHRISGFEDNDFKTWNKIIIEYLNRSN